jgi:hypothetical protein
MRLINGYFMQEHTSAAGFFVKIFQSLFAGLGWMVLQVLLGMYFELVYWKVVPVWLNILYYIFFVVSGWWVFRYIVKKWSRSNSNDRK